MGRLEIAQLTSVDQLRAVASDWDQLWCRAEVTLPTARAELVAQWLEFFAPQAPLRIEVVRQDGRMVAALPLVGRRYRHFLSVGDLTLNYWSPNGELLVDPAADQDAVYELLATTIQDLPWPLLWLEFVPYASRHWQGLLAAFARHGLITDIRPHYEIGVVELSGRFADYEAQRSRNLRRSLRKDLKRLEENGPVTLNAYSRFSPDEVQSRLRQAFEIENRSWKGERGQTVLQTPGMFEFYLRQAQQMADWGCLRLAFLEHNGKPFAFDVGWVAKNVYHSLKVGFDQEYRNFGPGHLLRRQLIESLFAQSEVRAVDFQGPLTEALAGWANRTYPIGRIVVGVPNLKGRLLMSAYQAIGPLIRRWRRASSES